MDMLFITMVVKLLNNFNLLILQTTYSLVVVVREMVEAVVLVVFLLILI